MQYDHKLLLWPSMSDDINPSQYKRNPMKHGWQGFNESHENTDGATEDVYKRPELQ